MTTPKIKVVGIETFERNVSFRLPFRFGMTTLEQAPQLFVRCHIRFEDGGEAFGQSAEMLVPKWFSKDPQTSNEQDLENLRTSIRLYRNAIMQNGKQTAFGHYESLYFSHIRDCAELGILPLAAGYGPALIDRAIFDSICRYFKTSFAQAMQKNLAGMVSGKLTEDIEGANIDKILASFVPGNSIDARHTVGLLDPLRDKDIRESDRLDDGVPQSLETVIDVYGNKFFKLKLGGNISEDINRLTEIAEVLDENLTHYFVTLDGNEQYQNVDQLEQLVKQVRENPALRQLNNSLMLLEQPLIRSNAFDQDLSHISDLVPVIVDESDDSLNAYPQAQNVGYRGISAKSCKGFYKAVFNKIRTDQYSDRYGKPYIMTAEDLTCQAGLCLQQDLALISFLGLTHGERNGHHYVKGMSGVSGTEQSDYLEKHPDLYREVKGETCVKIVDGKMSTQSVQCIGYGATVEPDWASMQFKN